MSASLSAMCIFSARNFHSRPLKQARKWSRFMAPVSGACVMGLELGNFHWEIYSDLHSQHYRGHRNSPIFVKIHIFSIFIRCKMDQNACCYCHVYWLIVILPSYFHCAACACIFPLVNSDSKFNQILNFWKTYT